jgi:hypothetical protein
MVLEHPLGYSPGNDFRKNEIHQNAIARQSISTNDRNRGVSAREVPKITPNYPQIYAQQPLTTHHLQEATTNASPHGETGSELFKKISPPATGYQVFSSHGMTEGMVDSQDSRQDEYSKNLSPSNGHHQSNTTRKHLATVPADQLTLSNHGAVKAPVLWHLEQAEAFSKSRYSNGLVYDHKSTYPGAENQSRNHQRIISTQSTEREMETTPATFKRTRQTENIKAKRPSFQMMQQNSQEPLQRV